MIRSHVSDPEVCHKAFLLFGSLVVPEEWKSWADVDQEAPSPISSVPLRIRAERLLDEAESIRLINLKAGKRPSPAAVLTLEDLEALKAVAFNRFVIAVAAERLRFPLHRVMNHEFDDDWF